MGSLITNVIHARTSPSRSGTCLTLGLITRLSHQTVTERTTGVARHLDAKCH
ncbi:hypothetical protein AB0F91_34965 [Amycolatopsis sp. NPDC023774]|uniref:hypothetical protein n=1 Tax=Amycolatopsis sp. NPDC023774 TaxID=3155015 RepID=UPI0033FEB916